MRRREIAVGIPRAAVENARTPPPALACAAPPHKFALIAFRAFDAHGDRPRVLALRISGAADELAKAPVLFHQSVAAERTLFIQQLVRLVSHARARHQPPRGLATGRPRTCKASLKSSALFPLFLPTLISLL